MFLCVLLMVGVVTDHKLILQTLVGYNTNQKQKFNLLEATPTYCIPNLSIFVVRKSL